MEAQAIIWIISLAAGLLVIGVVAFLLYLIQRTAAEIDTVAGRIWTQGKLVANNTIQIPLFLSTTNREVSRIQNTAGGIVEGAVAIRDHARGCPGCPDCVLDHSKSA